MGFQLKGIRVDFPPQIKTLDVEACPSDEYSPERGDKLLIYFEATKGEEGGTSLFLRPVRCWKADDDYEEGVYLTGAPVRDDQGSAVAEISLFTTQVWFTKDCRLRSIGVVIEAADKLSKQLGYCAATVNSSETSKRGEFVSDAGEFVQGGHRP